MGHPACIELVAYIPHTVLGNLTPGIIFFIVHWKDLVLQHLVQLFEVIIILLLDMHIGIISFGDHKAVIPMVDKFRYPAIIRREIDSPVHGSRHTAGSGRLAGYAWIVQPAVRSL